MSCKCWVVNFILAAIIFVLTIAPADSILDTNTTLWVAAIASALLLIHSIWHRAYACDVKPAARRRRR